MINKYTALISVPPYNHFLRHRHLFQNTHEKLISNYEEIGGKSDITVTILTLNKSKSAHQNTIKQLACVCVLFTYVTNNIIT